MGSKSTTPASVQFLVMRLPLEGGDPAIFTSIFGPLVGFILFIKTVLEVRARFGKFGVMEERRRRMTRMMKRRWRRSLC